MNRKPAFSEDASLGTGELQHSGVDRQQPEEHAVYGQAVNEQVTAEETDVKHSADRTQAASHETAAVYNGETTRLYYDELVTPIGTLTLLHSESGLCHMKFRSYMEAAERLTEWANRWYGAHVIEHAPERLAIAKAQLEQYFAGERRAFDLPLDMRGTAFQLQVWEALCTIPYGEAVSYKYIAQQIGSPAAVRAVGGANNRNPVSIIVPCHRVIGMNGQLVGYGGGLDNKQFLLGLEGWHDAEAEPTLF